MSYVEYKEGGEDRTAVHCDGCHADGPRAETASEADTLVEALGWRWDDETNKHCCLECRALAIAKDPMNMVSRNAQQAIVLLVREIIAAEREACKTLCLAEVPSCQQLQTEAGHSQVYYYEGMAEMARGLAEAIAARSKS